MAAKRGTTEQEQLAWLADVTGNTNPAVNPFGPATLGFRLARYPDYPRSGVTTFVTLGFSQVQTGLLRNLPVGQELVLSLAVEDPGVIETLRSVVLEDHRRTRDRDRQRYTLPNGVFAPGFPPHMVFTQRATETPDLMVHNKRLGDRYVTVVSAIPIDEVELRARDRDVPQFLDDLAASGRVAVFPR